MNTFTVTRPNLTEEERAKRMAQIKEAAIKLILETEKVKQTKSPK